jgi:hypothetical protein
MGVSTTTYAGTTLATTTVTTTATVTLGSIIGIDALTIMFGLFGGFVALAFPINREAAPAQRYAVTAMQVMAAGMVAAALTEVGLFYTLKYMTVTHEGAAKAVSFSLGYLAKWLLPSIAASAIASRNTFSEFVQFWIAKKK